MTQLDTVNDLAEFLRTTPTGIRRMRERGALPPAVKIGVRVLWDHDEIERWLAEQREEAGERP